MHRIYILCEGQTEETFVKRLLSSHFQNRGKQLIPCILRTKRTFAGRVFRGGVSSYERIKRDILNLLKDSKALCITTMLDYYALPQNFPGMPIMSGLNAYEKVMHLEEAFRQDIANRRFYPYLVLHEFEAFIFVNPRLIPETLGYTSANLPEDWEKVLTHIQPEEINDGPDTHPSARIIQHFRQYRKALHGPLITERIGLQAIRERCPHFNT